MSRERTTHEHAVTVYRASPSVNPCNLPVLSAVLAAVAAYTLAATPGAPPVSGALLSIAALLVTYAAASCPQPRPLSTRVLLPAATLATFILLLSSSMLRIGPYVELRVAYVSSCGAPGGCHTILEYPVSIPSLIFAASILYAATRGLEARRAFRLTAVAATAAAIALYTVTPLAWSLVSGDAGILAALTTLVVHGVLAALSLLTAYLSLRVFAALIVRRE